MKLRALKIDLRNDHRGDFYLFLLLAGFVSGTGYRFSFVSSSGTLASTLDLGVGAPLAGGFAILLLAAEDCAGGGMMAGTSSFFPSSMAKGFCLGSGDLACF